LADPAISAHDHTPALHHAGHRGPDCGLTLAIKRGGRRVRNQDGCILQDNPDQRGPLTLPARKPHATRAHQRINALPPGAVAAFIIARRNGRMWTNRNRSGQMSGLVQTQCAKGRTIPSMAANRRLNLAYSAASSVI